MIPTLIIGAIIIIAVINSIYSHIYGVVNMPSTPQTQRLIIRELQTIKAMPDNPVMYDIGSGWGGFCRRLKRAFPSAMVKGIEISPVPYYFSCLIRLISIQRHYTIINADLFKTDLTDADVIVCYLSPQHMEKFKTAIWPTLKKGTLVYSQGFPMDAIEPMDTFPCKYSLERFIYKYQA